MIFLVPMGGKGKRFVNAGYTINKASIPTTDRHTEEKRRMVVCAMKDMPGLNNPQNKVICVSSPFHATDGTEKEIKEHFPHTLFIHDHASYGQGFACLMARKHLQNDEELFIGACDNGFAHDPVSFREARNEFDVLMISHTNNENIKHNPKAHSWAELKPGTEEIKTVKLKQPVSSNPMNDHATTGMFWYKKASDFITDLQGMIHRTGFIENERYVDEVLTESIKAGRKVGYFDVTYICWGTPSDYELYERVAAKTPSRDAIEKMYGPYNPSTPMPRL